MIHTIEQTAERFPDLMQTSDAIIFHHADFVDFDIAKDLGKRSG